ncbi:hypothetical protein Tco_0708710, partial [Tanacetum coccineum]
MLRVLVSVISKPLVLTSVQESPSIAIVTTLPPLSVSTTPPIPQQTTTPIPTPPITTDALTITTVVSESDALSAIYLRVAKLEKEVSELKKIDLSVEALAALKTQVPYFQIPELPKNQTPTFDLEQKSEKSPLEILKIKKEQAEKQKMLKFTIKSIDKAALKEFDQKSTLYQTMHANKSFNKNPANHRLYHAHMEALIEDENVMDKGVVDTVKDYKRSMMMMIKMMMLKTLQLDQTRVRRQRGEEPRSQSLPRSHPPPRKPLKVKLQLKALKL